MTPLEMIAEWRKGCAVVASCGMRHRPEKCEECTLALINALEARLKMTWRDRLREWLRSDSIIIARRRGRQRIFQAEPIGGKGSGG